jgi:hypothetical protein
VTALDVWAFVVPALSFVQITIVGQLIVSEVLMVAMLPWLWSARDRPPLPRWFVVLLAGWFFSQVVTDAVAGTAFADFARGWAAIAFTFTDFAAILVLISNPRRVRLFTLGGVISGVLGYLLFPSAYAALDPWKWALSGAVGGALLVCLSGAWGARRPALTVAALTVFGLLNLFLGARSAGGISLLTAGYLVVNTFVGREHVRSNQSMLRVAAPLAFLALMVAGVLQLYGAAASEGLLGADSQAKYQMQSGTFGVLLGGRSEVLASSQAIIDSPILGHGSWAKDFKYVDLLTDRLSSLGYEIGARPTDVGLIPAHSFLLGSWVWAGFLGGLFWLVVAGFAIWLLANLYSFRMELAPILVSSAIGLLWSIAFSPYGATARIGAMSGLVICLLGVRLLSGEARVPHSSSAATAPPPRASDNLTALAPIDARRIGPTWSDRR